MAGVGEQLKWGGIPLARIRRSGAGKLSFPDVVSMPIGLLRSDSSSRDVSRAAPSRLRPKQIRIMSEIKIKVTV